MSVWYVATTNKNGFSQTTPPTVVLLNFAIFDAIELSHLINGFSHENRTQSTAFLVLVIHVAAAAAAASAIPVCCEHLNSQAPFTLYSKMKKSNARKK